MEEWRGAPEQLSIDPDRLLAAISTAVPDPDELARHFTFDVRTFQIAMPDALPTSELIDLGMQQEIIKARQPATVKAELLDRPAAEYRDSRYARDRLVKGPARLRETAAGLWDLTAGLFLGTGAVCTVIDRKITETR